jgi:hypothetical protein
MLTILDSNVSKKVRFFTSLVWIYNVLARLYVKLFYTQFGTIYCFSF